VVGLTKELGVIGGDELDEPLRLIALRGLDEPAVVFETGAAEVVEPLGESTGDEGPFIRPQPDSAPPIDDVHQEGEVTVAEVRVRGRHEAGSIAG